MGLLTDFQGLSSISTVQITTRALLFLVTFVMESNSMGCPFVSEVIKVVKMWRYAQSVCTSIMCSCENKHVSYRSLSFIYPWNHYQPSVHNQRIERLWCDVFRCVLSVYHRLFYYFEERGKLDPLSERDLYCLHLVVYLNKINTALKAFQDGWNNHVITTEHSMTPVQLFTSGVLLSEHGITTIYGIITSRRDSFK